MTSYEEALAYIDEIPKFTEKHSNEHTKLFLAELQEPQSHFKVIHVAGSNGKGSVCMMLYHTLLTAGKKACGFFSPHLVDIRERFMVCDHEMCSKELFLQAFSQVKETADRMNETRGLSHPSYFEFLFLMAMLIFKESGAEYVVLETGLGGRMDATNSIAKPELTIITSISLEHTEYLGNTIEEIAGEKAGIIKDGVPVIFDGSNEAAAQVIRQVGMEKNADLYEICPQMCMDRQFKKKSIDFSLENGYYEKTKLELPFVAEYQIMNGALAVTALQFLQHKYMIFSEADQLQQGIRTTYWPGRMEEVLPEIYFDGAHNAAGIEVFLQTVRQINKTPARLLFSMVRDKDYEKAIHLLAEYGCWDEIVVTHIPTERGIEPEILQQVFAKEHLQATVVEDYSEAFAYMQQTKQPGQHLFCTGSLYFIGALKELVQASESVR